MVTLAFFLSLALLASLAATEPPAKNCNAVDEGSLLSLGRHREGQRSRQLNSRSTECRFPTTYGNMNTYASILEMFSSCLKYTCVDASEEWMSNLVYQVGVQKLYGTSPDCPTFMSVANMTCESDLRAAFKKNYDQAPGSFTFVSPTPVSYSVGQICPKTCKLCFQVASGNGQGKATSCSLGPPGKPITGLADTTPSMMLDYVECTTSNCEDASDTVINAISAAGGSLSVTCSQAQATPVMCNQDVVYYLTQAGLSKFSTLGNLYIYMLCPEACSQCHGKGFVPTKPPPGENCPDNNPNCPLWAEQGQCSANPGYMLANCRKSCKTCPTD